MLLPLSVLVLGLATATAQAGAANPGGFADGGNTLVSGMMLFLGNEEKVYILDKAELNAAQINGHPAWGAVWDVGSHQTTAMDVRTNTFCSSGMHLPNGSYVTFGGNGAVGPGGSLGSQLNPGGYSASWDQTIQDFDGTRAIRILNPCRSSDNFNSPSCQWYDEPTVLAMKKSRWYSAAEATGDGRVVVIGGFVNGGYVNRNYPNVDPALEGGAAEPTYEYYPPTDGAPQTFQFLIKTSGLNAYAHTFLMPSGKMFVQANLSTVLWDYTANQETPLPDMPGGVARVYPASGATAMLPLTPANNYTPTVLFCGGSDMPEYNYGNYTFPFANTWEYPSSRDCQRITPEPQDGSAPVYVDDDDMLEGRTMGQFIILPTGKLLVINGGSNGTAGFSNQGVLTTPTAQMPFGQSLASGPVLTPAIYDPNAAKGQRWARDYLYPTSIPRLYHSSAILLPDASVLIAGSNPNIEVNTSTIYPTTYRAEIFYPPYFNATIRPVATGIPQSLSYGGPYFDLVLPATAYYGIANDAADSAQVVLVRPGFTTHAMNMGQRHLQLNNTYTVNANGTITLHVSSLPPNPNVFQPGPALLFVNVHGIPSNGTYVLVGNGQIGQQPTQPTADLPASQRLSSITGSAKPDGDNRVKDANIGIIVGATIGGVALLAMLGALVGLYMARRRRLAAGATGMSATRGHGHAAKHMRSVSGAKAAAGLAAAGILPHHNHHHHHGHAHHPHNPERSGSDAFVPLRQDDYYSQTWNAPYVDAETPRPSGESYYVRPTYQAVPTGQQEGRGLGRGYRQY